MLFFSFIVFIPAEKMATNSSASFINFSSSTLSHSIFQPLINSSQNKLSSASSSTIFNLFKKSAFDLPLQTAL
jgi:hypothetical protein